MESGEHSCPYCLSLLVDGDAAEVCPACKASYHADCWQENGGCSVYGCAAAASPPAREDIEIPVSYWGREHKDCPACGEEILATALRCRHCGKVFASATPLSARDLEEQKAVADRLPGMRKSAVAFLVFGVLTFTAPLAAIFGVLWRSRNKSTFRHLDPLYRTMFWVGIAVGFGQTAFLAVLALLTGLFGN